MAQVFRPRANGIAVMVLAGMLLGVVVPISRISHPPRTCMTCHSELWANAAMRERVRRSLATG